MTLDAGVYVFCNPKTINQSQSTLSPFSSSPPVIPPEGINPKVIQILSCSPFPQSEQQQQQTKAPFPFPERCVFVYN